MTGNSKNLEINTLESTAHHPPTATTTYKPHGYGMITVTVLVQTIVLGQSKLNSWPVAM